MTPWGSGLGAPDGVKGDDRGNPATKRICGFASRLLLGPVIPKTLKMGVAPPCMVFTMKEAPQNITGRPSVSINVTGWVSMWVYDMLSQ